MRKIRGTSHSWPTRVGDRRCIAGLLGQSTKKGVSMACATQRFDVRPRHTRERDDGGSKQEGRRGLREKHSGDAAEMCDIQLSVIGTLLTVARVDDGTRRTIVLFSAGDVAPSQTAEGKPCCDATPPNLTQVNVPPIGTIYKGVRGRSEVSVFRCHGHDGREGS
jgi:hypothetical protein